jgi:hypothetical protein
MSRDITHRDPTGFEPAAFLLREPSGRSSRPAVLGRRGPLSWRSMAGTACGSPMASRGVVYEDEHRRGGRRVQRAQAAHTRVGGGRLAGVEGQLDQRAAVGTAGAHPAVDLQRPKDVHRVIGTPGPAASAINQELMVSGVPFNQGRRCAPGATRRRPSRHILKHHAGSTDYRNVGPDY